MLLDWHAADPVSRKEIERNGTIYALQHNRNPFIDRPEFAAAMYVTTGVDDEAVRAFHLSSNIPNPFNPSTTIRFELPRPSDVRLSVYDVSGRLVAVLVDGKLDPGGHEVAWRGRDSTGAPVASGVYFCRMEAGDFRGTIKMVSLK
jgi:hypothetical protein